MELFGHSRHDHMIGMNVAGRMVKQLESPRKTTRDENWVDVQLQDDQTVQGE